MNPRTLWTATVISVLVYLAAVAWAIGEGYGDAAGLVWALAFVPGFLASGLVLLWKRPADRIGQLLLLGSIVMFVLPTALEAPTVVAFGDSGAQSWMWFPMWLAMTLSTAAVVILSTLVVLLPDGRVRHRRERRFLAPIWIVVVFPTLSLVSNPTVITHSAAFPGVSDVPSPLTVGALEPLGGLFSGLGAVAYAVFLMAIGLQVMRYRSASQRERKQVRWVLFAGIFAVVVASTPAMLEALGLIAPMGHTLGAALTTVLPLLAFPVSVVIAVLEPSWIDIDIVIRKSVVYGALSAVILLLYVAVAAAFGVAAGSRLDVEIAVILAVIVAVLFQPARSRLQQLADRWVFGTPRTGYEALAEMGEEIDAGSTPDELLPRLASTIVNLTAASWVVAQLDDGTRAVAGDPVGDPDLEVPIGAGHEQIGEIRCGLDARASIDTDQAQLIHTLAGQVGLAVMNARLAARIASAAEIERRRIERNIHDGAQQELVALVARLGMTKAAAGNGGVTVADVEELQREAQRILADLRELAQGIHPSVLSDGGLLEAVEDRCSRLPIDVALRHSGKLRTRRFDDQVEGAAYFFVTESLANVLKHAGADHAEVGIRHQSGHLHLEVSDNGHGFDHATVSSGGLAGLRDRIHAVGGAMTVNSSPDHGTVVSATIPVKS